MKIVWALLFFIISITPQMGTQALANAGGIASQDQLKQSIIELFRDPKFLDSIHQAQTEEMMNHQENEEEKKVWDCNFLIWQRK